MTTAKIGRMWAFPGARLTMPRSFLMQGGDNTPVTSVTPSFLIEHPKGLLLFDTGCNSKILDDPVGYWGPLAEHVPIQWNRDETLDRQIVRAGYKLDDVKYVVLSHAHLDHAGGLALFPKAKFIVGAGELRYAYWPDPDRRGAFILEDYLPTRNFQWVELDRDLDLFGDGSVQFLFTPGHTPGESSLMVNLPNRRIILTGDTVHLRAQLAAEVTMPLSVDPISSVISLKRLKAMSELWDARIWISHDPEDWAEYPHVVD